MSGLRVWGKQGWAKDAAPGALPPLCCGDWPQGRWLTQQQGQEAGLSTGATYIGEACNEQDGMSKSGNDEGTALSPPALHSPRPAAGGRETRRPGLEHSQPGSTLLLVHVVLQAAEPTVLLVDLPHGQDAVQHALQHAPVHGDD